MSLKETYSVAHTARCKLHLAVSRPDRDLRFLVGHAMLLDDLNLRIIEIEDSIDQSKQASAVKFKGTLGTPSTRNVPTGRPAGRSPPPRAAEDESDSDEGAGLDEYDDGEEDLGLTRFASASAAPPRQPSNPPELVPSDDDGSSDEEWDEATIRDLIDRNKQGDESLLGLYHDVNSCPCHKSDAPAIERIWEISEETGRRIAVAEIKA
jgi:hypothetical protein